jgi:V/A-type H+/Na+-transporting ATPase subunit F
MSNYRIAIVGQKEAIQGFALLGVDIVPAHTAAEATDELFRLKKATVIEENGRERNKYAIVFLTEDLAGAVSVEDERKLSKGALPAIIPLPSHKGSSGYALDRLSRIVERAIGSNILK